MRILQAGNVNFGYIMAKELRKRGIESDLLLSNVLFRGSDLSINDPLNHDKDIDSLPDWVFFKDTRFGRRKMSVIKKMRKYDLIHTYNEMSSNAMLSHKPYLAQTGGDELRVSAFKRSISGYLLKKSFQKANQLVYVWPIHKTYVEKLGIKNAIYLPRIWDTKSFGTRKTWIDDDKPLTFFFPTWEIWETKGNEKFLKAFVRLCKEKANIFLYFIDWGKDSPKAKILLSVPEVQQRVEIIPGPVSREKMAELMEKSHILVDQFNSGSFNRIGIEAFSFGIPILINLDEPLHAELHNGEAPPVINAKNENEIYEKLKYFIHAKDDLTKIAQKAQKWSETHFDLQKNVGKYLEVYEKMLRR